MKALQRLLANNLLHGRRTEAGVGYYRGLRDLLERGEGAICPGWFLTSDNCKFQVNCYACTCFNSPAFRMNIPAVLYKFYEPLLWAQIKHGPRPHHIGLIVDGNRRFAKGQGLAPNDGHNAGSKKLEDFLRWCWRLDIRIVTLYGFSTENYKRSDKEVQYLMDLILRKLRQYQIDPVIKKEKVRINVLGQRNNLSDEMVEEIVKTEELTRNHNRFLLNIAISYGGRAEIVDAVRKIGEEIRDGNLLPEEIDEKIFESYLYTEGIPDPDLIIRTSGEERLSGFLLWQSAYSELYFTEVYWPAFRMIDFWRAIRVYQQRERRFGK